MFCKTEKYSFDDFTGKKMIKWETVGGYSKEYLKVFDPAARPRSPNWIGAILMDRLTKGQENKCQYCSMWTRLDV